MYFIELSVILFNQSGMTYQAHEFSNLGLAGKYFNQLNSDDISRRYYAGEKYSSNFLSKLKFLYATDSILSELYKFYPYQPLVKRTWEDYNEKKIHHQNVGFGISVLSLYIV